jgi:hypothetical protein
MIFISSILIVLILIIIFFYINSCNIVGGKSKNKKKKKKKKGKKKKMKKKKGKGSGSLASSPASFTPPPPPPSKKIFYIYTTGISDWATITKLATVWIKHLRDRIIENIHPNFDIVVEHYDNFDPCTVESTISREKKYNFITKFTAMVEKKKNTRIKKETFIEGYINFDELEENKDNKKYLLVDLAHIFQYPEKNKIELNSFDYSGNLQKQKILEYYNIKCVYPGYCGQFYEGPDPGEEALISCTNFIKIDENGNVITFIDRIFDNFAEINKLISMEKINKNPFIFKYEKPSYAIEKLYELFISSKDINNDKLEDKKKIMIAIVDYLMDSDTSNKFNDLETFTKDIIKRISQIKVD